VSDLSRSYLPASLATKIRATSGVDEVSSIKLYVADSGLVFGLRPEDFVLRRFVVTSGRKFVGPGEVLAGDQSGRTLGQTLVIAGHPYRVVGIYHSGDRFIDVASVLPLAIVQQLAQRPSEVTTFGVTVKLGWKPAEVAKRLEQRFPGVVAVTEPGQAVKVDTSSRLIISTGWIVSLLALIVGGIGVTNTMAMSVFERMSEIGLLRAVGWRTWQIGALIVSEALGICLVAAALGIGLGVLAAEWFVSQSALAAMVQPSFPPSVWIWGVVFALGVALLGAIYPTWRAVRLTPLAALRHE